MKKFAALILLSVFACLAYAQSAEKISQIIESQEISYGQSAWLALSYAEENGDQASYEQALSAATERGWLKSGAVSDSSISLQELCGIFVKAAGLKGGLLYRLSKADRYAFKELKANGTLDSAADPSMKVSGQNAVAILNACVKKSGGAK
ncbi:MAG: hypothetical protein IJS51_10025 [Treponema sp.]|nr:hypothetical protein [Treponema sp.]